MHEESWTSLRTIAMFTLAICLVVSCAPAADVDTEPADAEPVAEPAPAEEPSVTMTTGQGTTYTLTLQNLADARGYIYCELVILYGDEGSDIYSTSPLAECDVDWWDNLDLDAVAEQLGGTAALKNGPQWWSMDEVGIMGSEPIEIAGVQMIFGAHLPPGTMDSPPYTVFSPAKYQNLVWKAGEPTYRLVDPDGYHYVIQGHKVPAERLPTLGDEMEGLPEGWQYVVEVPETDLVMNLTPAEPIPSVQDEFDQIYIRIPGQ